MKLKLPLSWCCLALLLFTQTHAAELKLEIIPLHYRNAAEVIPIIRPFIGAGGTLTGMNNQLIIKAAPEDITAVKKLLASIDKKPRHLMITVTHDIAEATTGSRRSISGSHASGNVDIMADPAVKQGSGAGLTLHDKKGDRLRYRIDNARSMRKSNSDLRVQTLEGQPAFIESGSQVPLTNRTAYQTGNGVVVQDSVEYHNATTGFYVIPRLSGDTVTLSISPFMTKINPVHPGTFNIENIETTVQGRLGEWIDIGGIQQQAHRQESTLLSESRRQQDRKHATFIKVEELP